MLDLAAGVSACCIFLDDNKKNVIDYERIFAFLKAYARSIRLQDGVPVSQLEIEMIPEFMIHAALACAFYRYETFEVPEADGSDNPGKGSYLVMWERVKMLEAEDTREKLNHIIQDAFKV